MAALPLVDDDELPEEDEAAAAAALPAAVPVPGSAAPRQLKVEPSQQGVRLDQFLARQLPDYSRVHLRKLINAAAVKVDGKRTKASYHLHGGETIDVELPELVRPAPRPENIPLDILHEDDDLIVVNKPFGMVVHPAKGHWAGTLTSALAFRFQQLSTVGGASRPGIVHRLDRDTSGVMVVAKNDTCHLRLGDQFEHRTIQKEYLAIVAGRLDRDSDQIDQPIGLHPFQREKMTVRRDHTSSRTAQTFYQVLERFNGFTYVRAKPKTGRTHQIRVHLDYIGCPVLCDRLYGGRAQITYGELIGNASDTRVILARQALHAAQLTLEHPTTGVRMTFTAPLAGDIAATLDALRATRAIPERRKGG